MHIQPSHFNKSLVENCVFGWRKICFLSWHCFKYGCIYIYIALCDISWWFVVFIQVVSLSLYFAIPLTINHNRYLYTCFVFFVFFFCFIHLFERKVNNLPRHIPNGFVMLFMWFRHWKMWAICCRNHFKLDSERPVPVGENNAVNNCMNIFRFCVCL